MTRAAEGNNEKMKNEGDMSSVVCRMSSVAVECNRMGSPLRDDVTIVDEIESYFHEHSHARRGRVSPRSKDKLFL